MNPDLTDPAQFRDAYARLTPLAVGAAERILRDRAAAEDVAQDVFVHLWRKPTAYDPRRGSLPRYVSMLARSRALDRYRSQSAREAALERSAARVRTEEAATSESAAEPAIRRERSRQVLGALERLPEEQREALLLAYGRGLTAREIALASGIPVGTAKSRLRLGLEKAREGAMAAA